MNQVRKNHGFTLIELMLAMGFVSALLLAIAMTVIQISNIYNHGITYKSVNQFGGSLASGLQRDISQSAPFDTTSKFIPQGSSPNFTGGRLCIGQYSYIWNYGKALEGGASTLNKYSDPNSGIPISFAKVIDTNGSYCGSPLPKIDHSKAVELLNVGASNQYLAIHNFSITPISHDSATNQYLYGISFVIGTNDTATLNGSFDSTECKLSDDANADQTYCAVNRFDIVARAGSKSNRASE